MTSFSGLMQTIQGVTGFFVDIKKTIIVGIIVTTSMLLFGFYVFSDQRTETKIQTVILGGLKEISDFNVVKMQSKATVVEQEKNVVFSIPLGQTKVIYEGVGTIRVGMDMKSLEIKELSENNHLVHIILPPPYITETTLDVESSRLLDHHRDGISFKSKIELQDQAQRDALKTIRVEACENGIMDAANKNAKEQAEKILYAAGYRQIIIDTQAPKSGNCPIF
ncbi:DUF4230 domain-containing protein [Nostoc spongiaeforme FACHB-130]|uniref:DUF4230 domain-containing protein n=1 Tax=Nostoc spongiaeforme FACHB-130 TaxID=1357510 RepID=A0ABR8G5N9_9NOSO|nr:DUF4230 domain-containing protein [Nostoc spongiaeforme]MBD2598464.1 DUF4230 domain-containing protein [Nostoc spongiaeforme FACHB-130]